MQVQIQIKDVDIKVAFWQNARQASLTLHLPACSSQTFVHGGFSIVIMLFIICRHIYLTSPQSSLPSGYMFSILFSSQWIQLLSFQAKLIQELLFQAAGKSQHLQTHFQQCPQTQSTLSKSVIKLSKWLAFTIINIVSSYYHQIIIIFALCLIVNCPLGHG